MPAEHDWLVGRDTCGVTKPDFTYPEVGATASDHPAGYHSFTRTRTLKRTDFDAAASELMTWQVQSRAGLRVAPTAEIAPGVDVTMYLGPGRLSLTIPCRVVYVVDEPDRKGFAYGTLPGHPETGEEAFVLQRRADGQIDFTVSAFSRPATLLTKLGGPFGRLMQRLMTNRYLSALDRT